jgi:hypothetical protein
MTVSSSRSSLLRDIVVILNSLADGRLKRTGVPLIKKLGWVFAGAVYISITSGGWVPKYLRMICFACAVTGDRGKIGSDQMIVARRALDCGL